jgi:hypothetical protein
MLWFPQTKEACLLRHTMEDKWWMGATDGSIVMTAWSSRPETPQILAQAKVVACGPDLARTLFTRVEGKLTEGYKIEGKWEGGMWQGNPPQLPFPTLNTLALAQPEKGKFMGHLEMIKKGAFRKGEETCHLELYGAGTGVFQPSVCRLDHYEGTNNAVPIWQTMYKTSADAMAAVAAVVKKMEAKGYAVFVNGIKVPLKPLANLIVVEKLAILKPIVYDF